MTGTKDAVDLAGLLEDAAERGRVGDYKPAVDLMDEAAATIRALHAEAAQVKGERDAAVEVLRPFAEAAEDLDDSHRDGSPIWEASAAMSIDAGHLRDARTFLATITKGSEQ